MIKPFYKDRDCTLFNAKWETILPLLPDDSVDMILCDLPYGQTDLAWDCKVDLPNIWQQWLRVAKLNAAFILFAIQPFTTDMINSQRKIFRYDLIWEKSVPKGFLNAKRCPLRIHEYLLVFYRRQPTYNPQMTIANRPRRAGYFRSGNADHYGKHSLTYYKDNGSRYPQSILDFPNTSNTKGNKLNCLHPTQKPVALCEYLIRTYSNTNDVVLDSTCGVGTTLLAAKLSGRKSIGIEKSKRYCRLAVEKRFNKLLKAV